MKKSIILACTLYSATLTPLCEQKITPIEIDSKILRTVDGNSRIIKMGEFISFQRKIHAILSLKMPTKKMPECTFKSLVALEKKLPAKERDAVLHKFIHEFAQIMQHNVFDDLKLIQTEVNKIIEDWSQQRERPDTPILIFKTKEYHTNHEEALKLYITTLAEFDILLEDLHLFFEDLIYSLPKSYSLYQERLHEQQNQ